MQPPALCSPPGMASAVKDVPANMWMGTRGRTEFSIPYAQPWLEEDSFNAPPGRGGPSGSDIRINLWNRAIDLTPFMLQHQQHVEEAIRRMAGAAQGERYEMVRAAVMEGSSNVSALERHCRDIAMSV